MEKQFQILNPKKKTKLVDFYDKFPVGSQECRIIFTVISGIRHFEYITNSVWKNPDADMNLTHIPWLELHSQPEKFFISSSW
jgi:hypothetical protein